MLIAISRISPLTGKSNTMNIDVEPDRLRLYQEGMCIQDAFPNLTPSEREFIKTGLTDKDWAAMFGSEDDY